MISEEQLFMRFLDTHPEELEAFNNLIINYAYKAKEEGYEYVIIGTYLKPEIVNKEEHTVIPKIEIEAKGFGSINQMKDFYMDVRFTTEWKNSLMFDLTKEGIEIVQW